MLTPIQKRARVFAMRHYFRVRADEALMLHEVLSAEASASRDGRGSVTQHFNKIAFLAHPILKQRVDFDVETADDVVCELERETLALLEAA